MPDSVSNKMLDGAGVGFLWSNVQEYVDANVLALSVPLPIPVCSSEVVSGNSAKIRLDNNFTGYGNVTVRYKLGSEPSSSDSQVDTVNGTAVSASGTYYIKAFPEVGSSYLESAAFMLDVSF